MGLAVGFAAGYYLGSKAGRERHAQINRAARRLGGSSAVGVTMDKGRAVANLTVERVRGLVEYRVSNSPLGRLGGRSRERP